MNLRYLLLLPCLPALGAISCLADTISLYPYPGTPVQQTSITATATANVIGTFISTSADANDLIRLYNETSGTYSAWLMPNQTSTPGQTFDFGAINAGDRLAFEIESDSILNPNGYWVTSGGYLNPVESSDASISTDGVSSFYASMQNGTLVLGAEDIPRKIAPNGEYYATPEYKNVVFSVSNATGVSTVAVTPEPASFLLLGTGLAGAAGIIRRRLSA